MINELAYKKPGSTQETRLEKIHNVIFDNSKSGSKVVAREIADLIKYKQSKKQKCILGLATGSSPITVYEELVNIHKREKLSFKNVITFNLDEYYPISNENTESYYTFMHQHLFDHVDINKETINIPRGDLKKNEIEKYCKSYESKIENLGGIDFQLLGIGRTGHIGFNEPGSSINSITRLIKLDYLTREDASKAFGGIYNVPKTAITMGVSTILSAKRIVLLAWGENKKDVVYESIESSISQNITASFLQKHNNTTFVLDKGSSSRITRIDSPWLVDGNIDWDINSKTRAVAWLCNQTGKSLLRLSLRDYIQNHLSELAVNQSTHDLNIEIFNRVQRTITGWPGGKPNSDDTYRPERAKPEKKRVIIFSPHPDDDVISMGGTFQRLVDQEHDVHVVYQTSGNIAVSNDSVLKFLEVYSDIFDVNDNFTNDVKKKLLNNNEIIEDKFIRKVATKIREKEALAATRYVGLKDENVHFLRLPFYESGKIVKNKTSKHDSDLMNQIITKIKPHQIYAAGDLADPHGTHSVCIKLLFKSLKKLKKEKFMNNCWVWLYRGAWHEWEINEIDMAVPLSPQQVLKKRKSIFFHKSQNNSVMFQGDDKREFWERVEERNRDIAKQYRKLGMADYQAMETFRRYHF
ncbi:MAG: glucosamine-6-phosphate deaminase [Bacteroidota bacterium]|nr:glucosamine-6-phosphate deaminase [Bacteroidota bacterium]